MVEKRCVRYRSIVLIEGTAIEAYLARRSLCEQEDRQRKTHKRARALSLFEQIYPPYPLYSGGPIVSRYACTSPSFFTRNFSILLQFSILLVRIPKINQLSDHSLWMIVARYVSSIVFLYPFYFLNGSGTEFFDASLPVSRQGSFNDSLIPIIRND